MKEFRCGDLVPGCGTVIHSETQDEILVRIAAHARDEHGMPEVPPDVVDKVLAAIHDT